MINFFNKLKIKEKLLVIFFFCVFIPIVLTNIVMVNVIKERLKENQLLEMDQTTERIQYNIDTILQEVVKVSENIYTDRQIDTLTKTIYSNETEYYDSFFDFKRSHNFRNYYSSQTIKAIEIYTSNPSIINGDFMWNINDIKNEKWYKVYQEKGDMSLIEYYDTELESPPRQNKTRKISFVKRLDYFTSDGDEVILKIDLNFNKFLSIINNQNILTDIIIATNEEILMENIGSSQINREMLPLSSKKIEEPFMKREFKAIDNSWEIYVLGVEPSIVNILFDNKQTLLLLISVNFLIPTICIFLLNKSFRDRLIIAEEHILLMREGNFQQIKINEGSDEIGDLIKTYNFMVVRLTDLINETYDKGIEQHALELAKKQTELNALQSQINPHFLYNILDGIRMNCYLKGEEETGKIVEDLALLFRRMQKWEHNHFVTVKEELFYVEKYLNLQKHRFSDRLNYSIYLEEDCEEAKIPKMAITTFVENACIHGIEQKIDGGHINISVVKVNDRVVIEVLDSGIGIDSEKLKEIKFKMKESDFKKFQTEDSTGILNAYLRVKGYYHSDVSLTINSEIMEGTEIILELPYL